MSAWSIRAIDPIGCGCTECLIGETVPLDASTFSERMLVEIMQIENNTGLTDDEVWAYGK